MSPSVREGYRTRFTHPQLIHETLCKWVAIHNYATPFALISVLSGKKTALPGMQPSVSGMKFRVRPKKTHWERDFYAVITFQRKRNFTESRSSRQSSPARSSPFFFHFLFCSISSPMKKYRCIESSFFNRILKWHFSLFVTVCHLFLDRCFTFVNF